jgi:hypothetical protein
MSTGPVQAATAPASHGGSVVRRSGTASVQGLAGGRVPVLPVAAVAAATALLLVVTELLVGWGRGTAAGSCGPAVAAGSRLPAGAATQKRPRRTTRPAAALASVPPPGSPSAGSLPSSLDAFAGQQLLAGQSWRTARVTMTMQANGELVIYDKAGQAEWASGTVGTGYRLIMQADGNLVIYNRQPFGVWSSGTGGDQGAFLEIQGSGDVVIIYHGKVVWSAGT